MKEYDIIGIMASIIYCGSKQEESLETATEKAIVIYDISVDAKDNLG